MFCVKCGKQIEPESKFCSSCGTSVVIQANNKTQPTTTDQMYEYKTEILKTSIKWISDNASEEDIRQLNELIAQRATQGWEYVNHTYSQGIFNWKQSFHITFRRIKT